MLFGSQVYHLRTMSPQASLWDAGTLEEKAALSESGRGISLKLWVESRISKCNPFSVWCVSDPC